MKKEDLDPRLLTEEEVLWDVHPIDEVSEKEITTEDLGLNEYLIQVYRNSFGQLVFSGMVKDINYVAQWLGLDALFCIDKNEWLYGNAKMYTNSYEKNFNILSVELPEKEHKYLEKISDELEFSKDQILTQSLRVYQLYRAGMLVSKDSENNGGCGSGE